MPTQRITAITQIMPIPISEGVLLNGKLSVSVSADDLIVSVKTLAGNDPSESDRVITMIDGIVRVITNPLSITKADATDWANLGSPELGGKEHDLFPYLIWNTNLTPAAVDIGWSRVPYAEDYGDLSSTTTDEKYFAVNSPAPASTDPVTVIGRFAATLSLVATNYKWTVPTFTRTNLIQRPIYQTRKLTWSSAHSASGSMTWGTTSDVCRYWVDYNKVFFQVNGLGTTGGTASNLLYATLPFQITDIGSMDLKAAGTAAEGATNLAAYVASLGGTPDKLAVGRYDNANWGLGVNRRINVHGYYSLL